MTDDGAKFDVIFLGTGVSTAVPSLNHILTGKCELCKDAYENPNSKNRRNNVAIAVVFEGPDNTKKCLMIDAGKTMRDACMAQFPRNGIQAINGLLITHGHADAMMGLDDLRDLQIFEKVYVEEAGTSGYKVLSGPIPIYLHKETMDVVTSAFKYLTGPSSYLDPANYVLHRRVACLEFNVIEQLQHINFHGLSVQCFPVWHGGQYVSLGFTIGKPGEFVYISDVKIIPEPTMAYLRSLPRIGTLVIDALSREGIYPHMGLKEALEVVKILRPRTTYFTGMSCSMGDHDAVNAELAAMDLRPEGGVERVPEGVVEGVPEGVVEGVPEGRGGRQGCVVCAAGPRWAGAS